MKRTKKIIVPLLWAAMAVVLGACSKAKTPKPEPPQELAIDAAHNARNSLNWAGRYTGLIPAADGPGIEVQITLEEVGTYELIYSYLERDSSFQVTGNFTWNDAGDTIILDNPELPPYYWVGENTLTQLDMEGNSITGPLADMYILKKDS